MRWRETDFTEYLRDNEAAERAINNLVSENCSCEALISLLRRACDPNRQRVWRVFLGKWVPSRQRAERIAQMLTRASVELRQFVSSPWALPLLAASGRAGEEKAKKLFYGESCESLAEDALDLAGAMERLAHDLRLWGRSSALLKVATRAVSFRAVWKHVPIALAIQVVRPRAGKVRYGDLAYALEAVAAGFGLEDSISPDALRREHQRFIRSKTGKAFLSSGLPEFLLSHFTTVDTKDH